jgi:hypothetical protein
MPHPRTIESWKSSRHPARLRFAQAVDPPPPGEGVGVHGASATQPAFFRRTISTSKIAKAEATVYIMKALR